MSQSSADHNPREHHHGTAHRGVDPIRQHTPVFGEQRRRIERARDAVQAEIDQLQAEIRALHQRYREARSALVQHERRLALRLFRPGRRPQLDGAEALPPVRHDVEWIWGRRLRSTCLQLLRNLGPLSLTELHRHLHERGFGVGQRNAVKSLADALGYEVDAGRAVRVARGVYGPADPTGRRPPAR